MFITPSHKKEDGNTENQKHSGSDQQQSRRQPTVSHDSQGPISNALEEQKQSSSLSLKHLTKHGQLVSFVIIEHEHMRFKKEDHVMYKVQVNTASSTWTFGARYSHFHQLNKELLKNQKYKDKIPPLPPKQKTLFNRSSPEVIKQRKVLLSQYMNKLAQKINIFDDELIVQFLKKDFNSDLIKKLSEAWEHKSQEISNGYDSHLGMDKSGEGSSGNDRANVNDQHQFRGIMGDIGKMFSRKRIYTENDDDAAGKQKVIHFALQVNQQWRDIKHNSVNDRISSFIEFLNTDPENQSQLVTDWSDYYFEQQPELKLDQIKRIMLNTGKQNGLISYLRKCHIDPSSVKTKAFVRLFKNLLDYNKCPQVEPFKELWRQQKLEEIKECRFDVIIQQEKALKENVFDLLAVYLDGRLFQISNLITDEQACHKYLAYMNNKKKVQTSFVSNASSPYRSKGPQLSKSAIWQDSDGEPSFLANFGIDTSFGDTSPTLPKEKRHESSRALHKLKLTKSTMSEKGNNSIRSSRQSKVRQSRGAFSGDPRSSLFHNNEHDLSDDSDSDSYLQSESSIFEHLDIIQQERLNKKKEATGHSIRITVPRHLLHIQDGEVELKEDQIQMQQDIYGFDINLEIAELIKRYMWKRINMNYSGMDLQHLNVRKIFGQTNQYNFVQLENAKCYHIRLENLRRILEGSKVLSMIKKPNPGEQYSNNLEQIPESVVEFFQEMETELIHEIDEFHKIVKYTFTMKDEQGSIELQSYTMLLSYQVIGKDQDTASISIFQYDEDNQCINPENLVIVTQKINTKVPSIFGSGASLSSHNIDSKHNHQEEVQRTLSVVAEDELEGSYSLGANKSILMNKLNQHKSQFKQMEEVDEYPIEENYNAKEEDEIDEQNNLLVGDNKFSYSEQKGRGSFTTDSEEINSKAAKDKVNGTKTKWSMSTTDEKSSSQSSHLFNFQHSQGSQKHMNHPFDETLRKCHGEVSCVIRVADNSQVLSRLLKLMKGLGEQIKGSIDAI